MENTNWIYLSNNKYAPKILAEDAGIKIRDNKIIITVDDEEKEVTAIYCSDGTKYKKCKVYIGSENNTPELILDNQ